MKFITTALIIIFLFSKCQEIEKDPVKLFIEGTYVSSYATRYSKGNDTLEIGALSKDGNNYHINRYVTYQRIRNGKLLAKESKQEQWLCIYKAIDRILYETKAGKIISFIPEGDKLLVGNTQYRKIGDQYVRKFKLSF